MKKLILAVMLVLAIPGAIARDLTNKEKSAIMQAVKNELNDPESAHFKWMKVLPEREEKTITSVCSLVNAKNGYGVYVGYQPFWAIVKNTKGKTTVIEVGLDASLDCLEIGYDDFSEAK